MEHPPGGLLTNLSREVGHHKFELIGRDAACGLKYKTVNMYKQHILHIKTFVIFAEGPESVLEVNLQVHLSTFLSHHLHILCHVFPSIIFLSQTYWILDMVIFGHG